MASRPDRPFRRRASLATLALIIALLPVGSPTTLTPAAASTTTYMLDNGIIRFGGGGYQSDTYTTQNSVVASGMLQQPYYLSPETFPTAPTRRWFPLTYSPNGPNPLMLTIGTGTGSAHWSGTTIPSANPFSARSGLDRVDGAVAGTPDVDGSGIVATRTVGSVVAGHGTLVTSGTATINDIPFEIEHKYLLGATDNFVQITTTLRNTSNSSESPVTAQNVHVWVGTRDDWVGTSDGPTKTRGNLVDGTFTQIANASEQSSALRITTAAEGVLFYSTTAGTNTSVDSCCSFSNAYNKSPSSSNPSTTGDGSYAIVLPAGDIAAGGSVELIWFYAAGSIGQLSDVARAVAAAAGTSDIKDRTDTTATIEYSPSETGDVHRIVVPEGSPVPTDAEIAAGVAYGSPSTTPVAAASISGTQRTAVDLITTELSPTTSYVAYIVTEYPASSGVFSGVSAVPFTTRAGAPTGLSASLDGDDVDVAFTPGGGTVTDYEYRVDGGTWVTAAASTSPITIPGLTPGTASSIELRAMNGTDPGAASTALDVVIPAASITTRSDTTATVALDAHVAADVHHVLVPAESTAPTAAQIKAGADYGAPTVTPISFGTTSVDGATPSTLTLSALSPTTAYDLYVVVEYSDGGADVLSLLRAVTFSTRAGAPSIDSVTGVARALDVELTAGAGTVTNYATSVSTDSGSTWSAWADRSPADTSTSFSLSGLSPGECYLLRVRAMNGSDAGLEAETATESCVPAELPGTPTGLTLDPRDSALRVSFTAPAATGDARGGLTDYEFRLDGGIWRSVGSTATTFEIVELDNGRAYQVELRAVNGFGLGGATAAVSGTPGIPDATAVDLMLDNGRLRFGGDGHNATTYTTVRSVAESGMLRQPFYRAENGRWYRLTFSNAPLSMAIGTGTSGSNWTGSTVATGGNFDTGRTGLIALDSLTHSSTGWNERRLVGSISAGYGTLVVGGDVTANGVALDVQHTFQLDADDSFVEVTTRVTNPGASLVPNVNVWVGTRDDWVATSDAPTKARGNLVNGTFTAITDPSASASALRISSGGHGIFFHSTTTGANALHAACCSFSNTYNRAPSASPVTTTSDGSYGLHLPAGDLAAGASVELAWYYAAGSTADLVEAAREVSERPTPVSAVMPDGPVLRPVGTPRTTPGAPLAVIGGTVVQVSATPAGTTRQVGTQTVSSAAIVSAGSVAVALDVSGAGEVRTNSGSAPQVTVVRDRIARTSGGGLLPGTEVRAWLSLPGGGARAVTALPVAQDGTFSGELPFDGRGDRGSDGRPLPIGTHVLQLVGLDAQGQLAVIEQSVRIEQPEPSPEADRRASAPPTLTPGLSIATNAGVPEAVTVVPVPDARQARVEGAGWNMAVDIPSADGRVSPTEGGGALIELVEDDVAEVSGDGFLGGTRADVWLFSTPTLLGSVIIAADGTFSGEVDVTGIATGEHTLQLQGVGRDGYVRAANLGVVVVPRETDEPAAAPEPAPEPEAAPEPEPEPDGRVEVVTASGDDTGSSNLLVWIALLAAAAGSGWWFLLGRRRRDDEDDAADELVERSATG